MKPGNQTNGGPGANSDRAICKMREWLVWRYAHMPAPHLEGFFLSLKVSEPD